MKFVLLTDTQDQWFLGITVNEQEKSKLLGDQQVLSITNSLHIMERDENTLMIHSLYVTGLIEIHDLKTAIKYLESENLVTPEYAKAFQNEMKLFSALNNQFENINKLIPPTGRVELYFQNNSPTFLTESYNELATLFTNIHAGLEDLEKNVTNSLLSDVTKENFLRLIKFSHKRVEFLEKTYLEKLTKKIEFLKNNPTYVLNIDPEKNFEFILSNLKPVVNKQGLLQNLLLDEHSALARYRLKDNPEITSKVISELSKNPIRGITLYTRSAEDQHHHWNDTNASDNLIYHDASERGILEIEFTNGQKSFYEIPPNLISISALSDMFIERGSHIDYSSFSRGVGPLIDFFKEGLKGYTQEIEQDYQTIHNILSKELLTGIDKNRPVELVFIGCGKGEEIKLVTSELEKQKIPYRIYAIDIDPGNIEAAKKNLNNNKNIYFKAANAVDIDHLIEDGRKHFKNFNKDNPQTIAIASGCLTRKVNRDQSEAFEIFQKTAHYVDKILISGRTFTLITKRDAKKTGFNDEQIIYYSPEKSDVKNVRTLDIYTFKKMDEKFMEELREQKTINLTEHSRPFFVLQELDKNLDQPAKFWQDKIINLSDAYLSTSEIKQFAKFAFERDLRIAVSGNESWLPHFQKALDKLRPHKPQLFKPHHEVQIYHQEGTKLTKFIHEKGEVLERPKISEKLAERVTKSMRDDESKTSKKP